MTGADAVAEARSVDYRAFMRCDGPTGVVAPAIEQLDSWLRQKAWDVDLGKDGRHGNDDRELLVLHHESGHGRSVRARLTEHKADTGTWVTELTVHDDFHRQGWIDLNVTNSLRRFVAVPRLARFLTTALPLKDGELTFSPYPQVFSARRIDDLQDILCDPDRHGVVFVAGTDEELDFDPYVRKVEDWTRQVLGLAQVIVLDPHATREFRDAFGSTHDAPAWTVRTFKPEVDPASAIDARRHRILGLPRLVGMADRQIQTLLGTIARTHAATRAVPAEVARQQRAFARLENNSIVGALRDAASAAPAETAAVVGAPNPVETLAKAATAEPAVASGPVPIADAAELYLAQIELVKRALGLDELDEARLAEIASRASRDRLKPAAIDRAVSQIESLQYRVEHLEDELAEAQGAIEDEQLEHAITLETAEKRADEIRYLRRKLRDQGDYAAAVGPVPDEWVTEYPNSYEDLLDRVADNGARPVVFTGSRDLTLELAEVDTLDKALHNAWDAVLALTDYVRARAGGAWSLGFDQYVYQPPTGYRSIAPGKFGATETAATMSGHGDERMFPVPPQVDPSCRACMTAHFKLGRIGMVSPRMYFLDDYPRTQRVYIGYIGPHLTNTQTN